jgi:hypothetical protein
VLSAAARAKAQVSNILQLALKPSVPFGKDISVMKLAAWLF